MKVIRGSHIVSVTMDAKVIGGSHSVSVTMDAKVIGGSHIVSVTMDIRLRIRKIYVTKCIRIDRWRG